MTNTCGTENKNACGFRVMNKTLCDSVNKLEGREGGGGKGVIVFLPLRLARYVNNMLSH